MKVILVEDVDNVGLAGEISQVADGYARNYLIPRGVAVEATKNNLKKLQDKQAEARERREKQKSEAQTAAEKIAGLQLTVTAKIGEKGRLFGSVTSSDLAEILARDHQVEIDKRKIELTEPIKAIGDYQVPIKLYPGTSVEIRVSVVPSE